MKQFSNDQNLMQIGISLLNASSAAQIWRSAEPKRRRRLGELPYLSSQQASVSVSEVWLASRCNWQFMLAAFLLSLILFTSCRKEEGAIPSTSTEVDGGQDLGELVGFYQLNEGNMGSNKATLDYYDFKSGTYTKNIYGERNPGVVQELGDVGNDIAIYGSKLYAVINCSHFVEVMDAANAKHITQVSIPNCRYLAAKGRYMYVSSYAGKVQMDPNARLGYVAKVDTLDLRVVDTCTVGYQPDGMVIVGDRLYVANSGGYHIPANDSTVSVIDLKTFKEVKKIPVAPNLHRMEADRHGNIYVSSRGDYGKIKSKTFIIDTKTDSVTDTLHLLPATDMKAVGDSLYVISAEWSSKTSISSVSYAIFDVVKKQVVSRCFIKDGTEKSIKIPYGLAVNPVTREIYLADAKDYVTPGTLRCYSPDGHLKWSVTTGDIPGHIAFHYR